MNVAQCTDANAAYADANTCETACAGFGDADADVFNIMDTGGDSLDCRMYHLEAAVGDPGTHCGHTAEVSAMNTCSGTPM
jgi:hypothetical protein